MENAIENKILHVLSYLSMQMESKSLFTFENLRIIYL